MENLGKITMMKICAVVITYNRKELLIRNINKILQTENQLDIFIFDNFSQDGTDILLQESGLLQRQEITYYKNEQNIGGAGGFGKALEMVANKGIYDYFWLMDDDGYPITEDSLTKLLKYKDKYDVLNPLVICDKEHLSFELQGERSVEKICSKYNKVYEDFINPFNGTLISKKVVEQIGAPMQKFFCTADEREYILRVQANGFKVATITEVFYYHPNGGFKVKKVLGHKCGIRNFSNWMTYYHSRNQQYVQKVYFGNKAAFKHMVSMLIRVFLADKKNLKKVLISLVGIIDGTRGNFKKNQLECNNKLYFIKM